MGGKQFFDRRLLWALILVLPLVIVYLHRSAPSQPAGPVAERAEPASLQWPEPATPGPGRSFNVQELSAEGLPRTLFVSARDLPIVDIRIVFDAGAARDGELPGLAALTAGLLREGTISRSAVEVAREFESVGARFDTGSWRDMAIVELRSLSAPDKLQPALAMLGEVLRQPAFAEDALERDRKQSLAGLQARRQRPATVLSDAWYQALYPEHAYGIPPHGTERSLASIRRQDIVSFYRQYYSRGNAVIAIVGDLDRAQAEELATMLAAQLAPGEAAPPPPAPAPAAARRIEQDFPSAQTHLRIGSHGISRDDPDLPALMVGNEILGGGGLVSLLSQQIREQRGLAYSVYSQFTPMRVAGPFSIGLQTRNDQADAAEALALQVLGEFIDNGPDETAVAKAKRQLAGSFALGTASNAGIVGQLASIAFYGLPVDELDRHLARIAAVDRDAVVDAFRRHVDPASLLIVRVGPASPSQGGDGD